MRYLDDEKRMKITEQTIELLNEVLLRDALLSINLIRNINSIEDMYNDVAEVILTRLRAHQKMTEHIIYAEKQEVVKEEL